MKLTNLDLNETTEERLVEFGFTNQAGSFVFSQNILNDELKVVVTLKESGSFVSVFDNAAGDEYILFNTPSAVGEFVGRVRSEVDRIISEIKKECFKKDVFDFKMSNQVIKYIREKYSAELEFLWPDTPQDAIWRRKDNNKWFGIIMAIKRDRLFSQGEDMIEILNLKVEDTSNFVDGKSFFPGWHMNKKTWLTVLMDGSVEFEKVKQLIDKSYDLAGQKSKKK